MPLYPAIKLTDAVITAAFDFQPQLTSEPTAAEAYREFKGFEIKDFSFGIENPGMAPGHLFTFQPDLTTEPTALEYMKIGFQDLLITNVHPGPDNNVDDGLLLPAVQTDDAVTFTAIAMAESGGNTEAHNPHGEDSRGIWQINVDPAQPDVNPATFDCSELVQWANGTETLTVAQEAFWLV